MPIIAAVAAALALVSASSFAVYGINEDAIRIVVRVTTRASATLFVLAFAASSLRTFVKRPWTAWLVRNRRYIGLAFALAHFAHLAALIALGMWFYPLREEIGPAEIYGGGLAYLFIAIMAATSNDASIKWLGPKWWKILHSIGAWYLWVSFAQAYVPRAFADPIYIPFAATLIAVPPLRIAAWARKRKPAPTPQHAEA